MSSTDAPLSILVSSTLRFIRGIFLELGGLSVAVLCVLVAFLATLHVKITCKSFGNT